MITNFIISFIITFSHLVRVFLIIISLFGDLLWLRGCLHLGIMVLRMDLGLRVLFGVVLVISCLRFTYSVLFLLPLSISASFLPENHRFLLYGLVDLDLCNFLLRIQILLLFLLHLVRLDQQG